MEDEKLIIELNPRRPVELIDLTNSFFGVANEYRHFLEIYDVEASANDMRLYIKEIRPGSIITELYALTPFAIPLMAQVNTLVSFAKHLKGAYDYLIKDDGHREDPKLDKTTCQNLSQIVEPIGLPSRSNRGCGTRETCPV
jgi:hypothetical protein